MVVAESVSKSYHFDKHVIKDFSFVFSDGLYVLCGPHGSGKTTLCLMLGGSLSPDAGKIKVLGRTMYKKDNSRFISRNIACFFPSPLLIPYLSVLENVMLYSGFKKGLSRKQNRDRAFDLLESVELYSKRRLLANELTLGQMQRVSLCRSLFLNPQILIADEPTLGSDLYSATVIERRIFDFSQEKKKIAIVTSGSNCSSFVDVRREKTISLRN